jgi:hypothetical protein
MRFLEDSMIQNLFYSSIIFILFLSCEKAGCKDKTAINYDSKVTESNFTCVYETKGAIYWDAVSQEKLTTLEVTGLTCVFHKDTLFVNRDISSFTPQSFANCEDANLILFEKLIYSNPFNVELKFFDQNMDTLRAYALELTNGCETYKIIF